MEKNWREAKPKWVVEAAEAEMKQMSRRLALRWPDEARPPPVEFGWGGYDFLTGKPTPGKYFSASHKGESFPVYIKERPDERTFFKKWLFSRNGDKWTESVVRGPLYVDEKDAALAGLWEACDKAAADLEAAWKHYTAIRGFI